MTIGKIKLVTSKKDKTVGYLYLPNHPQGEVFSVSKKQISLHELMQNYKGPDIIFDFDKNDELIGIEIIG